MENKERLAAGRRNSPVGGLQAALGRPRSPRGNLEGTQLLSTSGQSATAALPIISESCPDPVQILHQTMQTSKQVATSSPSEPEETTHTAAARDTNPINLPGLPVSGPQLVPQTQPYPLSGQVPLSPGKCSAAAGTMLPHTAGTAQGDGMSPPGLVPLRGTLGRGAAMVTAAAAAAAASGHPFLLGSADNVNGGAFASNSLTNGRQGSQYSSGCGDSSSGGRGDVVLAAPPAATQLPPSLSQGFQKGLPLWLQEAAPVPKPSSLQQYHQPQAYPQVQPYQEWQHPHSHQPPQQQPQQLPQLQQKKMRSTFLPTPQAPRGPFNSNASIDGGAVAAAVSAAQQLHLARSLPAGGFTTAQMRMPAHADTASRPAHAGAAAVPPGCGFTSLSAGPGGGTGTGLRHGHGPQPVQTGPGGTAAFSRQDSPDELVGMGDTAPARGPTTNRGRSGIPRVASISEIEPVTETEEPPRQRPSNSLLTRAISIPNAHGDDRPRTYRVAQTKSQGSQDDVTVVLEAAEASSSGARGPRVIGGSSMHGSHYSYGSSGGGGGGGAAGVLSSSIRSPSIFGTLFGSRAGVGGAGGIWGRSAGGGALLSPDVSMHGMDTLPFAGRDRFFQRNSSSSDLAASAAVFGSLPATSLLRSRVNTSAGSILTKATGGLNTANTKAVKRSISYQQFGPLMGPGGGGAAAGDMPPSSSSVTGLRGRRPPRGSVNGGSDSSTSASASVGGGGLGSWLRGGVSGWGLGGPGMAMAGFGSGPGGGGSDSEGAVAGPVSVASRRAEPDLADLAILATSLPASLGTWSLPRSVALASSPTAGGSALYGGGGGRGTLSRADSIASGSAANMAGAGPGAGASGTQPTTGTGTGTGPSGGFPICLICLEVLSPEDFESGDAISLQCACKGEMSLRHRKCAIEWSHHKGDVICDICKQGIANLPPIPPEVLAAREAARRRRQPAFNTTAEPNFADFCFDCIRATWVTMIVCVLFFDVSVGQAFMLGMLVGVAFMLVSMVIAACARRAREVAAARAVERAAAESRAQEQLQQQQQQRPHHTSGGSGAGSSGGGGGIIPIPRRTSTPGSALTVPLLSAAVDVV